MNEETKKRAQRARKAVIQYAKGNGLDPKKPENLAFSVVDMLADLMHFCDTTATKHTFVQHLNLAVKCYRKEQGPSIPQPTGYEKTCPYGAAPPTSGYSCQCDRCIANRQRNTPDA